MAFCEGIHLLLNPAWSTFCSGDLKLASLPQSMEGRNKYVHILQRTSNISHIDTLVKIRRVI